MPLPVINNILYATDLSGNSAIAFRYAATMAKITNADIHVLHVLEKLSQDAIITMETFLQDPNQRRTAIKERKQRAISFLEERQNEFWSQLDETDQKLRERVKTIEVIEAYPAETILNKSVEHQCDMIIMGGHDRGFNHNFLGSVAMSVLRRSYIPTLIVPLPKG